MKKLVLRSLPYLAIGLIFAAVGEYFLFQTKEAIPIRAVVKAQFEGSQEAIYFKRQILENPLSRYKYLMWMKKQPKVLILGQSVTWQFRDFMFEPYSDDFYNTSLMVRNAKDLNYVLDEIESGKVKRPELVVLAVDFSFVLKTTHLDEKEWIKDYDKDAAISGKAHLNAIQRIWLNPELREIPATDDGYGKGGMTGLGYRPDGSYRHKPHIEMYLIDSTYRDGDLRDALKDKRGYFVEPFAYDESKAQVFLETVGRFKNLGIELILYMPPMSNTFFDEALKNEKFRTFWNGYLKLQESLLQQGYNVIPYHTPAEVGLSDDYMVDANHPGEVIVAKQLYDFVKSGHAKGTFINTLSFNTVSDLLDSENTIPVSFLRDSLSQHMLQAVRNGEFEVLGSENKNLKN